ncbi:MAG: triose-phosphate isomerase, partial [Bacteroidaceae bacterium]|nr:triose-phosphate isomerase [Bacteroidaceae bacterium]
MKQKLLWIVVTVCRLLVAAAFIFSGVTKMIDPHGTEYKLHDYAEAFHLGSLMPDTIALVLGMVLALVEFRIGISTLFGIHRRVASRAALVFMSVFTPLTLYLAIANPVSDCGCFGDALVLTNWQTFWKNVVLLFSTIVLVRWHDKQVRMISEERQWLVLIYSQLFVLCLGLYALWRLPLIDFRPFKIGANIVEQTQPQGDAEFVTTFLMEKDGKQQWFSLEDYPDSTWTFVDSKTETEGEFLPPAIDNLQMYMWPDGEDVTDEVLADENYTFLLTAPMLEMADDGHMDAYNRLYDYSLEHGYRFLCLTSSNDEGIAHWQDLTGAEYPFAHTDVLTLKTMVRSNPGLILLKNGVVIGKWPCTDMPELDEGAPRLEETEYGTVHVDSKVRKTVKFFLWFIIPLLVLSFLDRTWLGVHMLIEKRKRKLNNIFNLLNKKTMRKKIVAGNWKMNLNLQEGVALATELKDALAAEKPNCDVIICTPFIHLATVAGITEGTVIGLGAENCADKEKGAYTGEVSAAQVKSTGAQYVILGHSERRAYYGETAEILKEKVNLALANGLKVIFCIGEVLEEREANK